MKRKIGVFIYILILGFSIYGEDSIQYGTPFSGVPDPRDVSIYQVNIRSFSSTRNLKGVMNRIDSIKALGVNVIYLMPIAPVGTSSKSVNSPYCWKSFYSVGSEYGTLADLRNFVDSAHSLGMAVILDWVVNQTSWDNPWISAHKDWYQQDANGNIIHLSTYTDVAALNFSNSIMCDTMIQCMRNWIFTANIDGFRCDFANNPPDSFWKQCLTGLRSISTHKLLMFAEGDHTSLYTDGFDYIFGDDYYYNAIAPIYQSAASVTKIDSYNASEYSNAGTSNLVARYLSNHDVYGSYGSPFTIFGGKNGTMAAFVTIALMKSVPFIYNGMEVGNTVAMPFPFNSSVINWGEDLSVTPLMKQIIAFRNSSLAIRQGSLTSYDNTNICAFVKKSGTEYVFVISNLRNEAINYTLPAALANTNWTDAIADTAITLGSTIQLQPYAYKIYKGGTPTDVKSINNFDVNIYPNPILNKHTTFQLTNFKNYNDVSLTISDINGEIMLQKQHFNSGPVELNLIPGVYIATIKFANGYLNKKIIVE